MTNPAQAATDLSPLEPVAAAPPVVVRFWHYPWFLGLMGSLLFWAALPPLNWWPLGWLAVGPFVLLARQERLPGKRPYWTLYACGVGFWLASVYWLTLPHWATAFGWLAISIYMGVYWPLTVGLLRVAWRRLKITPVLAAPVIWTGFELARAHVFTGFLMAALGHTQMRRLTILQISDLGGAYMVSFLLALVGACLAMLVRWAGQRRKWWATVPLVVVPMMAWAYGQYRLGQPEIVSTGDVKPSPVVALIQGSIDMRLKSDPDAAWRVHNEYFGLSRAAADRAREQGLRINLIVWPETMFRETLFDFSDDFKLPPDAPYTMDNVRAAKRRSEETLVEAARALGFPALLGIDAAYYGREVDEHYNSALFIDRNGRTLARYDKCYLVMFGEYVPLADRFHFLYMFTPLPEGFGLNAGRGAQSAVVDGIRYAPNICYETTSPHLIRAQVNELRARGEEPDVLVNLTNDGWFWGSTELDMHLACGVCRAIETRKPLLVSANTGFSAWIEATGEIRAQGGRQTSEFILAQPTIVHRESFYRNTGDWFSGGCLAACFALGAVGLRDSWRRRQSAKAAKAVAKAGAA